jgi:hypothetical protein
VSISCSYRYIYVVIFHCIDSRQVGVNFHVFAYITFYSVSIQHNWDVILAVLRQFLFRSYISLYITLFSIKLQQSCCVGSVFRNPPTLVGWCQFQYRCRYMFRGISLHSFNLQQKYYIGSAAAESFARHFVNFIQ